MVAYRGFDYPGDDDSDEHNDHDEPLPSHSIVYEKHDVYFCVLLKSIGVKVIITTTDDERPVIVVNICPSEGEDIDEPLASCEALSPIE